MLCYITDQEVPMYSIAYNLKAIFQRIHTFDAKLLVTLLLEVVLSVLFPLLVNVFPAFLLWCAAQSSYAQAFTEYMTACACSSRILGFSRSLYAMCKTCSIMSKL